MVGDGPTSRQAKSAIQGQLQLFNVNIERLTSSPDEDNSHVLLSNHVQMLGSAIKDVNS